MRKLLFIFLSALVMQVQAQEPLDKAAVDKIRKEGMDNSKVMDLAFRLTDVSGPRLTASPGFLKAANWAREEMTRMGLKNATLEPWGDFGKGWEQTKCYVAMKTPYYSPLIAQPLAWTGSTPGGLIQGEVVLVKAADTTELLAYSGKLNGKIVMQWTDAKLSPSFEPDGNRHKDEALERMAASAGPNTGAAGNRPNAGANTNEQQARANRMAVQRRMRDLLNSEKPALILQMNARGNDGTIFASSGGGYQANAPEAPATLMLSSDDFLRIQRLVQAGEKVTLEADVQTVFYQQDIKGYNVIAEIPGSDPKLKDEIVMLGGHLDSWHASTGATDNAAGCSVMMEAVRILMSTGLKPKRTIRIALWSGEEQGLHGSRNYVKNHFADPAVMELKPEHAKVSAYYNLDNGTGRIRGVYLQGNAGVKDIFAKWLEPFADLDAKTITLNNTGGTDHLAFDAVGIPGFQFIQDEIEYNTRTHHTNMDSYDHLVADDLKQASVIVASFVYHTAQRDEKLPRKELPKPVQGRRGF
ncbi:MAG: M20/M25/M40 family metallo-hydrolase [Chitinophagaceae bacterium]|nr:M20/M25/M40 family metallo-hydrolase [Chitinophagaceae bacterium]